MTKRVAIIVLLTFGWGSHASAQNTIEGLLHMRETLKGASPLVAGAGVSTTNDETEKLLNASGIRTASVQTRLELRLRSAGIQLAEPSEASQRGRTDDDLPPMLLVFLKATCLDAKVCAVTLTARFFQRATIHRNSISAAVATWSNDTGLIAGRDRLDGVWDSLDRLVDLFSNDWLAANPRR